VERLAAKESDEGDPELSCDVHRQARGCPDRGDEGDSRQYGLLQDFETRAATHEEEVVPKGESVREQTLTEDLVDRIVSPDILPQDKQAAVAVKECSGVE